MQLNRTVHTVQSTVDYKYEDLNSVTCAYRYCMAIRTVVVPEISTSTLQVCTVSTILPRRTESLFGCRFNVRFEDCLRGLMSYPYCSTSTYEYPYITCITGAYGRVRTGTYRTSTVQVIVLVQYIPERRWCAGTRLLYFEEK